MYKVHEYVCYIYVYCLNQYFRLVTDLQLIFFVTTKLELIKGLQPHVSTIIHLYCYSDYFRLR